MSYTILPNQEGPANSVIRVVHESVMPRASNSWFRQELLRRVSCKAPYQFFLPKVSYQDCLTKESLQECHAKRIFPRALRVLLYHRVGWLKLLFFPPIVFYLYMFCHIISWHACPESRYSRVTTSVPYNRVMPCHAESFIPRTSYQKWTARASYNDKPYGKHLLLLPCLVIFIEHDWVFAYLFLFFSEH